MPKNNCSDIGAVRVRYFAGRVREFPSLNDAVCAIGWREIDALNLRDFGPDLDEWYRARRLYNTANQMVFIDHLGLVIPVAIVRRVAMEQGLHILGNYWGRCRPRRRTSHAWTYEFRNGPVPGIHCHRASKRFLPMRRMRTTQEIAEAEWLDFDDDAIEYGVRDRACRRNLPTYWDDRDIGAWGQRNWKHYRGTQWKPR